MSAKEYTKPQLAWRVGDDITIHARQGWLARVSHSGTAWTVKFRDGGTIDSATVGHLLDMGAKVSASAENFPIGVGDMVAVNFGKDYPNVVLIRNQKGRWTESGSNYNVTKYYLEDEEIREKVASGQARGVRLVETYPNNESIHTAEAVLGCNTTSNVRCALPRNHEGPHRTESALGF